MANKGIPKFPIFDLFLQKMSCPLFGVPTVIYMYFIDFFERFGQFCCIYCPLFNSGVRADSIDFGPKRENFQFFEAHISRTERSRGMFERRTEISLYYFTGKVLHRNSSCIDMEGKKMLKNLFFFLF